MISGRYNVEDNKVIINDNSNIDYEVLPPDHCQKCCFPYVDEVVCRWHSEDVMDKTLAIGIYYPRRNQKYLTSNLSKNIYMFKWQKSIGKQLGVLASIAINQIYPELKEFNYLVPIPRTEQELKEDAFSTEKFNPQLMLAEEASTLTGIKMMDVITKIKPFSQHNKNLIQRKDLLTNAEQYFTVMNSTPLRGCSVILIDDVRTTGYTGSACAKVLKAAGVGKIYLLVLGRDVGNGF